MAVDRAGDPLAHLRKEVSRKQIVVEQIVADPVPQILDGVQHVPRERVQNPVGKQMVDVPVPQIREEIVELVAG